MNGSNLTAQALHVIGIRMQCSSYSNCMQCPAPHICELGARAVVGGAHDTVVMLYFVVAAGILPPVGLASSEHDLFK